MLTNMGTFLFTFSKANIFVSGHCAILGLLTDRLRVIITLQKWNQIKNLRTGRITYLVQMHVNLVKGSYLEMDI